jgi:ABC-type Fe3+-hydroxamate transport system substrate-binding protein
MISLTDQLGRTVVLSGKPQRIISLVPSQTELLYYLGAADEIAGMTKFCIHPVAQVKDKLKIGGTKQLNIPLIRSLNPDLIIANKEENERAQLEKLMQDYPVYVSDPNSLPGALQMISDVGLLINRKEQAMELIADINARFERLIAAAPKLRVAYFIWRKPYMVAGKQTFIDDMLQRCGFINIFEQSRYPQITVNDVIDARPDVILLSSEPYPFGQKHVDELVKLMPGMRIKLVDGELFSWYGSRLLHSPAYFMSLIANINR